MPISAVNSLLSSGPSGGVSSAAQAVGGLAFGDVLKDMVSQTVNAQKTAETLTLGVANGENVALHDVVHAISQAQTTLQTLVTVRDKAVEAYQEIMRMAV